MTRLIPANVLNKKTGLWQAPITEESVVIEIQARLGYAGIPTFRIRERIPTKTKLGNWCKKSTPGISDLVGFVPYVKMVQSIGVIYASGFAVPIFIECKRPGGKRRLMQELFIERAKAEGCIACFAESWSDVVEAFKTHGIVLPG